MSTNKALEVRGQRAPSRSNGDRGDGTLIMEDAQVVFRNFAGEEGMYNRQGDRNFCVLLEEDLAQAMLVDGWNIKRLKPRDGAEQGTAYIQVSVGFKGRPPKMVMISSRGRVDLGEEDCVLFDWADILQADLIIRPYHWNVNGRTGVKAYLKSLFIIINEDYLELKYSEVPEIGSDEANEQFDAIEMAKNAGQDPNEGLNEDEDIVDAEIMED